MNFFEQELRRLAKACGGLTNPAFAGRACFGDLGGNVRVKLRFIELSTMDRYEALKASIISRSEGEADAIVIRFDDIWGKKAVANPSFKEGIVPYIRTYNGKSEWYVYKPTEADYKALAKEVVDYINVFTDRSHVPEKAGPEEKESVTRKIRNAKQNTTPHIKADSGNKRKPEL